MEDNFFSLDSLLEFGISMAIAQQLIQNINITHNQSNHNLLSSNSEKQQNSFYILLENKQTGPISEKELIELIRMKKVQKDTLVWKNGMPNWVSIENSPEVLKLVLLSHQVNP